MTQRRHLGHTSGQPRDTGRKQRAHAVVRAPNLPVFERMAIAAAVRTLLTEYDERERRRWTAASLASACGGISPSTIRRACAADGVGPTVRAAILRFTGLSMEQLMQRHGVRPPLPLEAMIASQVGPVTLRSASGRDRLRLANQVFEALLSDGFAREPVLRALDAALDQDDWETALDLYRRVVASMAQRASPN